MTTYTAKHKAYYEANKERIKAQRLERERVWIATPKGKYSIQKRHAKQRGISWELSFDEWWKIWQDSGKWDERGCSGYVMCRTNDKGPYAIGNVRIDTAISNSIESYHIRGVDSRGRFP